MFVKYQFYPQKVFFFFFLKKKKKKNQQKKISMISGRATNFDTTHESDTKLVSFELNGLT
jgi:hypothetical protein